MRVKLQWLKDYLDIKDTLDIEQLSMTLNMAGLEVEHIDDLSKKASLVHVDKIGNIFDTLPSASAKQDDYVAFIYDEITKKPEICTWSFFNFDSQEPIWFKSTDLSPEIKTLTDISEFNDFVITLGVTPNRCDALSHLGVSREVAALMDLSLKSPMLTLKEMGGPTHEKATVEIANSQDCKRYACRVIENIKIEESPWWLKFRLMSCGIRPINNVVDVTNYVMLSRGQPMHAFDYNKLAKDSGRVKILVRRALDAEEFHALDNSKLKLCGKDIVVCDQNGVIALAGVIGGNDKKVDESTNAILLESAYFCETSIRNTSKKYGISTESSFRFERGCDPNAVVDALNYAARLLVEISTGATSCREVIDAYRAKTDPLEISMRPERALKVLGYSASDFDQELIRKRFIKLGIETIAKRGDAIYFRIPTFRPDLTREIDLIEESARMIGLDKIHSKSFIHSADISFNQNKIENLSDKLRNYLVARGFNEAINYAFLSHEIASLFVDKQELLIKVKNPLSERYETMRPSLLCGLLKNIDYNFRNQEKSIRLFEVGVTFESREDKFFSASPDLLIDKLDSDSFAKERNSIAGVIAGLDPYVAFDISKKEQDFYHLKGIIVDLLKSIGFDDSLLQPQINTIAYLHPHNVLDISGVGYIGEIHPSILEKFSIDKKVFAFEIDLGKLAQVSESKKTYKNFSRFPFIERDLALLVDEEVAVGSIMSLAKKIKNSQLITSIKIFDIYRGKNLLPNKKSVALSLILQAKDSTLTDEDAQKVMDEFIELAKKEVDAVIR